ncbi:hypothetical protein MKX03_011166, partial [Papaver bracteatum]
DAKNKNIEIMGNTLYKAYLKDLFKFFEVKFSSTILFLENENLYTQSSCIWACIHITCP